MRSSLFISKIIHDKSVGLFSTRWRWTSIVYKGNFWQWNYQRRWAWSIAKTCWYRICLVDRGNDFPWLVNWLPGQRYFSSTSRLLVRESYRRYRFKGAWNRVALWMIMIFSSDWILLEYNWKFLILNRQCYIFLFLFFFLFASTSGT